MIDSYKHKGLRKKLVDEIRNKGIKDERILEAIEKVPRHYFLDSSFETFAYQDKPFPIGSGQTISQPYTVAFQTELLEVIKNEKVLEVGTGSGYQACIFLELGAKVYTIERHRSLFNKTKKLLEKMGYTPKMFYGDGSKGLPAYGPFNKILVTAAAPEVPQALIDQLSEGGILVVPVGKGDTQIMKKFVKKPDGTLIEHSCGYFRFVPLLNNKE